MGGTPRPELGHEIGMLDIVAVVLETMEHLVFDVLVKNEPIHHRSGLGRLE
jgi:hypothetical protein